MIAFTDPKVQAMVSIEGMEGYGAYCVIVGCLVGKNRSAFDRKDMEGFAWMMHMDKLRLEKLVSTMTACGLFLPDGTDAFVVKDAASDLKASEEYRRKMSAMGKASGAARRKEAAK